MRRAQVVRTVIDRARRNGGVITRAEALAAGANPRVLAELVAQGILLRAHPGVYVIAGAADDPYVAVRAAIAALGTGARRRTPGASVGAWSWAVASHGTAAWLQGTLERPPSAIHLTAPATNYRRPKGVIVHRAEEQIRPLRYHGIPCTPPVLTLVDLAAEAAPGVMERAVDRALANGLVRLEDIERGLAKESAGRRGAGYLRGCLQERGYIGAPTPSVLESDMGRLLKRMGLPVPRAEIHAGPDGRYRIDYVYGSRRLAIELYGYNWHHSPAQLSGDMARQRRLTLEGWTVLVYTWLDVQRDPERVATEISSALGVVGGTVLR